MPQCAYDQRHRLGLSSLYKIWYVLSILLLWGFLPSSKGLLSSNEENSIQQTFDCPINPPPDFKDKFLYIHDKEAPITLLTSRRIPHLLLTNVVATFLKKYLGYVNVTLVYNDGFFPEDILEATGFTSSRVNDDFVPKGLLNVAVWVPPAYPEHGFISFNAESYLGVGGRQGWFFLQDLAEDYGVLDHWRSFASPNTTTSRVFGRSKQEMAALIPLARNRNTNGYYCTDPKCEKGIFIPSHCVKNECSLLFSSYFSTSSFLIRQIEELQLYVNVIWIGPHLNSQFLLRNFKTRNNKSILFFHWTPDVVVQPFNLTSVLFPACTNGETYDYSDGAEDLSCRYEMHLFHKYIWPGLKSADIYLYEIMKRIYVTSHEYLSLIDEYNNDENFPLEKVACKWMLKNQKTWQHWRNNNQKPRLYFVGLFPMAPSASHNKKIKFTAPGNSPAFSMAVDAINKNHSILPDHEISSFVLDTACEPDIVMHEFIKIIQTTTRSGTYNKIIGIVGPACSDTVEPIAGVSKFFRMPIISYGAEGASFSDREQYPYFYRTIPENRIFRYVYVQLFKAMDWKRVASLTEDGQQYSGYLTPLQDLLQANDITFHIRKYPQERESKSMEQYLRSLKYHRYKIIIGDFYQPIARQIMCEALKLGMTGQQGYVWFLPRWFANDWYNMTKQDGNPKLSCSTEDMLRALDGHMTLSYKFFGDDQEVTHEEQTVRSWRDRYEAITHSLGIPTSDYAGFTYDATWTYALALNKLFQEDHSYTSNLRSHNTMTRFMHYLDQTNFTGVSGPVNFTHGTSRLTEVIVWQFNRTYRKVGRFYPNPDEADWGSLSLEKHKLRWPLGEEPLDGRAKCVVESVRALFGDDVSCSGVIIGFCLTAVFTVSATFVSVLIFMKRRYRKHLLVMEESLEKDQMFRKFQSWELQRSRVVINRKLGQGQFGTVYGGECFLEDRGWVAVAVKTLREQSSVAEKLDFLFEAEVMKELRHENIVELLGVITQSEPLHTVMEFMLYGDLKTFLLARRNLISEKSRNDDDEVSNRRLTQIALDIAKALEFLARRNHVHRDVACRNCLISGTLTAKLADFGLTRPLNASNYYRFSRRGPLPVRWMSIESVIEGVYTPMSDMWSYGVLLYEIVTFGATPYKGMSNNQVYEKVQAGFVLPVPEGVKPPLEGMINACFHTDPHLRPTASEMVTFLSSQPRVIAPCLEDPVFCRVPTESSSLNLNSDWDRRLSSTSNVRSASATSQSAASALQSNSITRKRSMSGNMVVSMPWDDSSSYVIDALNLNGSVKSNGTRICQFTGGCRDHLASHCDNAETETLIKKYNHITGVTSDVL